MQCRDRWVSWASATQVGYPGGACLCCFALADGCNVPGFGFFSSLCVCLLTLNVTKKAWMVARLPLFAKC